VRYELNEIRGTLDLQQNQDDYDDQEYDNYERNSGMEEPLDLEAELRNPNEIVGANPDSGYGSGGCVDNENSSSPAHGSVAVDIEPAVEEVVAETKEWIDVKDPNNLKSVDDHHFDGFRADVTQLAELAAKFNELPANAFSELKDEVRAKSVASNGFVLMRIPLQARSLFVEIVEHGQKLQTQGVTLAEFSVSYRRAIKNCLLIML
jgi:hypothetical protein